MKPPYDITPEILKRVSSVSEKIGMLNATYMNQPSPQLRKENRIKTIHASLEIEGNTLTEEQITAILDDKRVIGPAKDITEVKNAIKVYEQLGAYHYDSEKSFLKAHGDLMKGLIGQAGKYRSSGVGIVKGDQVLHIAPPYEKVPFLMKELFAYLREPTELTLIKSCVFHYELAFIHPFMDGNGRMGRLWQTLILKEEYPVFEFLPFETLISRTQERYYQSLALSDQSGKSTCFIEYMLGVIDESLNTMLDFKGRTLKDTERLNYFLQLGINTFGRSDYMQVFKDISTATASRDLKKGVELGYFEKQGALNQARYRVLG